MIPVNIACTFIVHHNNSNMIEEGNNCSFLIAPDNTTGELIIDHNHSNKNTCLQSSNIFVPDNNIDGLVVHHNPLKCIEEENSSDIIVPDNVTDEFIIHHSPSIKSKEEKEENSCTNNSNTIVPKNAAHEFIFHHNPPEKIKEAKEENSCIINSNTLVPNNAADKFIFHHNPPKKIKKEKEENSCINNSNTFVPDNAADEFIFHHKPPKKIKKEKEESSCINNSNTFIPDNAADEFISQHNPPKKIKEEKEENSCTYSANTFVSPSVTDDIIHHNSLEIFKECSYSYSSVTNDSILCQVCKNTLNISKLYDHLLTHMRNIKSFVCMTCKSVFKTIGKLKAHSFVHEQRIICRRCKMEFSEGIHLEEHLEWHYGKRNFACNLCKRSFYDDNQLEEHKNIIHGGEINNQKTKICKMEFSQPIHLEKQNGTSKANKNKPFACETCKKKFFKEDQLQQHIIIHGKAVNNQKTKICKREFSQPIHLKKQNGTSKANKNKPFACEMCKKKFFKEDQLQQHVVKHRKQCWTCDKIFIGKTEFRKHRLLHDKKDTAVCEICKKIFNRKVLLTSHLLIHARYPIVCYKCNKGFYKKRQRRSHFCGKVPKIHKCVECQMKFTRWSDFYAHTRLEPQPCTICKKTFHTNCYLELHFRNCHNFFLY